MDSSSFLRPERSSQAIKVPAACWEPETSNPAEVLPWEELGVPTTVLSSGSHRTGVTLVSFGMWGVGQRGFLLPTFLSSLVGLMMTRWIFTTFHSWLSSATGLAAGGGSSGAELGHSGGAVSSVAEARLLPSSVGTSASLLSTPGFCQQLPLVFPPTSPVHPSCSTGWEVGAPRS